MQKCIEKLEEAVILLNDPYTGNETPIKNIIWAIGYLVGMSDRGVSIPPSGGSNVSCPDVP